MLCVGEGREPQIRAWHICRGVGRQHGRVVEGGRSSGQWLRAHANGGKVIQRRGCWHILGSWIANRLQSRMPTCGTVLASSGKCRGHKGSVDGSLVALVHGRTVRDGCCAPSAGRRRTIPSAAGFHHSTRPLGFRESMNQVTKCRGAPARLVALNPVRVRKGRLGLPVVGH